MALVTLQTIFQEAFPAYAQPPLPAHVRKAARAIMPGRTAALGGPIQACPDGHIARVWYNACRHRSCPPCASLQTERWWAQQRARLLACDHAQVLFTLPHDLHALWLANVPVMTTLVLQAVRDTLGSLLADPKSLGAQPGILAALHPWSQTLLVHPPLHCVVTGGGRTPAGQWSAVRRGFWLPGRVVMAVLRGKLLDALHQAFDRDEWRWPETRRPQPWLTLLHRLRHPKQTRWNVRIMERSRHGAGVVTSLARSRRGGPIKNARLVAWAGACVTLRHRARHEGPHSGGAARQRMRLPVADFLQRCLQHGPIPQTRVVRCDGLSHHTPTEALALCRLHLGQPPVAVPAPRGWQTACAQRGDTHPERCPACGQLLVCTAVIPRGGAPPLVLAEERAAYGAHCEGRPARGMVRPASAMGSLATACRSI